MKNLLPQDGELYYWPNFLGNELADLYFASLEQKTAWQQRSIKMFGKSVLQPRLTAWYGDDGKTYKYSGLTWQPQQWLPDLLDIKHSIESEVSTTFNSVLMNLYRHGQDSMGWHNDNERELGPDPALASLSLGQTRTFRLRHLKDSSLKLNLELEHGSLLLMQGTMQNHWQHCTPKQMKRPSPRINLTFRKIIAPA